jgi:hypothetical protein
MKDNVKKPQKDAGENWAVSDSLMVRSEPKKVTQ